MAVVPTLSSRSFVLFLALVISTVTATPPKTFNVMNYGAKADGKTDNRLAFLAAWKEACAYEGTATVAVPGGKFLAGPMYFHGPCKGAKINFSVEGTILANQDLNAYKKANWVMFSWIKNLTVTGNGVFDGQGAYTWPKNHRNGQVFPTSIQFSFVDDSIVEGITSLNAKMFHIMVYKCTNIKLKHLTITAPEDSPNTDGIHLGLSTNVEITDSKIGTGDDCISVGPTNNGVTISRVFCGPGHGISIGSLGKYSDDKDVENLIVKNCTISNTTNGVRIKSWQNSYSLSCRNFTFDDIRMDKVLNPIIIDQEYCPSGKCASEEPSKVKIVGMKFENIRGTSVTPVAINLKCSKAVPCKGVEFSNIKLTHVGSEKVTSTCVNVAPPLSTGNVFPAACV